MGIKKTKLMACKSIYSTNINDDFEKQIKIALHVLIFILHNGNYLYIVDYHSKYPVMKKMEDISADSIILTCKIVFSDYSLLKKIMSDSGGNFISDKFKTICRSLNIEQAFSSYHQQSNGSMQQTYKVNIK